MSCGLKTPNFKIPYYKNEGCYWTENLQNEMCLGCSITKESWKLRGSAILHFEIYMTSPTWKQRIAIFLWTRVVTGNRCLWPCCSFLDILNRMYVVPDRNPHHLISYVVLLEKFALYENKTPCKSLCCHRHDKCVDSCHGDCWCAE